MITAGFRFDRNYRNVAQVEPFYDEYVAVFEEVRRGDFAYDDDFVGRIPGLAGPDEATGIYLLQNLRRLKALDAKIEAFLADGGRRLDVSEVTEKPVRYATVVRYGWYSGGTGWAEWDDARLVLRNGNVLMLPKGHRTNGTWVTGGSLLVRDR